jgi:hypothetical protein
MKTFISLTPENQQGESTIIYIALKPFNFFSISADRETEQRIQSKPM